jgi:hypothetical protein
MLCGWLPVRACAGGRSCGWRVRAQLKLRSYVAMVRGSQSESDAVLLRPRPSTEETFIRG